MSSKRGEREAPAAASIHSTDSGSRQVKNNARCTFLLMVGSATTMMRVAPAFCAANIVRRRIGSVPTRESEGQNWLPLASPSARKMANTISFPGERLLEEFALALGDVATVAVVLAKILDPRCFLDRVSKTKQMAPTAAQKSDRNRLDNPKANPVALLSPNILPISMVPPS